MAATGDAMMTDLVLVLTVTGTVTIAIIIDAVAIVAWLRRW
jgi:hypothetical protein